MVCRQLIGTMEPQADNCPHIRAYYYILYFCKILLCGKESEKERKDTNKKNFYNVNRHKMFCRTQTTKNKK
jgi:hypothetical protein